MRPVARTDAGRIRAHQDKNPMKPGLPRRLLLCPFLLCCVSAVSASGRASLSAEPHGPPWSGPVASSQVIHVGGATIQIDTAPGALDLKQADVIRWVEAAAKVVSSYYGKFPLARARILVVPVADRSGVLAGTTWGDVDGFPAFTRIRVGQHATEQDLADDWTMTHELVHMGFPSLSEDHHWLEEGLATYIEPIARAQIGMLSPEKAWGEMLRNMPEGEPGPDDHGLDQTHTWGRTYWGGAIFCLMADVTIREKTGDRKGLPDALRAIVAAGGTIDHEWSLAKVIAVGDKATGTSVLSDLYQRMGEASDPVDLDVLWKQMGVASVEGNTVFDDQAPLARIRQKITAPDLHPAGT